MLRTAWSPKATATAINPLQGGRGERSKAVCCRLNTSLIQPLPALTHTLFTKSIPVCTILKDLFVARKILIMSFYTPPLSPLSPFFSIYLRHSVIHLLAVFISLLSLFP